MVSVDNILFKRCCFVLVWILLSIICNAYPINYYRLIDHSTPSIKNYNDILKETQHKLSEALNNYSDLNTMIETMKQDNTNAINRFLKEIDELKVNINKFKVETKLINEEITTDPVVAIYNAIYIVITAFEHQFKIGFQSKFGVYLFFNTIFAGCSYIFCLYFTLKWIFDFLIKLIT